MKENTEIKENPALLTAFDSSKEISETNPDYADVQVAFKVVEPNTSDKIIINSAQISDDTDKNGKPVDDIDSVPDKWNDGEDDQDKEYIKLTYFDLALRKFITGVNDKQVTNRIPEVSYDKENNKITYNHTKEPVEVVTNDTVVYTIRVYNEGEVDGYASKISDDLPAGLEYLPENELNKEYRWIMYDKDGKETTNVSEAVKITTDISYKKKYLRSDCSEKPLTDDRTLLTEAPAPECARRFLFGFPWHPTRPVGSLLSIARRKMPVRFSGYPGSSLAYSAFLPGADPPPSPPLSDPVLPVLLPLVKSPDFLQHTHRSGYKKRAGTD